MVMYYIDLDPWDMLLGLRISGARLRTKVFLILQGVGVGLKDLLSSGLLWSLRIHAGQVT